jgi:hypothetical protein
MFYGKNTKKRLNIYSILQKFGHFVILLYFTVNMYWQFASLPVITGYLPGFYRRNNLDRSVHAF